MKPVQNTWSAAAAVVLCAHAGAQPIVHEPGIDPEIGYNLISWWNFGTSGESIWTNAVQEQYDAGFRDVAICPIRYVNLATGDIPTSHALAPETAHIEAAVVRAKSLGMTVTINPFITPEGFSIWRGNMNFSGAAKAEFWSDYTAWVLELTAIAEAYDVDIMHVASELVTIMSDPAHNSEVTALINAVDAGFSGRISYASVWFNYQNANLTANVWEHPAVDFIGIDAYFQLATNAQADASGAYPDEPFIAIVEGAINSALDAPGGILDFATARKGGAGMPVAFSEFGLIPYNRCTKAPQSTGPKDGGQPVDQDEQLNGYEGVLRALDGRINEVERVTIWQWGMPGAEESLWYTNTNVVANVGDTTFDEGLNHPAAVFLSTYVGYGPPICDGDIAYPFGVVDAGDVNAFVALLAEGCQPQPDPTDKTFTQNQMLGFGASIAGSVQSVVADGEGVLITGTANSMGTLAAQMSLGSIDVSSYDTISLRVEAVDAGTDLTKMFTQNGPTWQWIESDQVPLVIGEPATVTLETSLLGTPTNLLTVGFQFFNGPPNGTVQVRVLPAAGTGCGPADAAEPFGQLDSYDLLEFMNRLDCP